MLTVGGVDISEDRLTRVCQKYGVRELSVFGSRGRGDHKLDSDIDILVEFLPSANLGFIGYASLQEDLADLFELKVDLVSKRGLKPIIRDEVLPEARAFYEAS